MPDENPKPEWKIIEIDKSIIEAICINRGHPEPYVLTKDNYRFKNDINIIIYMEFQG